MESQKRDNQINLLLVDDELEFLDATATALGRRGFTVFQANDGKSALMAIEKHSIDVIVLDVKMPGIDGVDLFRQIKRILPEVPILLLTGHGSIKQAFETSKEGIFEYLTKPCDIEQLAETVKRASEKAKQTESLSLEEETGEVRLLFVDDEQELLETLSNAISRRGINVTCASSGEQALRLLEKQLFDVALVDVKMPGMDGVNLIRHIRRIQPLIEIIILTGHPSVGSAFESIEEGVFEFLMKPQKPEAVVAKIHNAYSLKKQKNKQQQERQVKKILEKQPD